MELSTRITELFGIRYPIIQGGMLWVSGWKLAVAVSRAGGLGLIGAGSMKPKVLDEHLSKAGKNWNGPLGVNIPLLRDDAAELVEITLKHGIKIVFTSAGNPGKFTGFLHEHDVIVAHVVPSLKLARKAVERGVDVIVGEGVEAGGHNGYEEIPTFPLIPRLVENIDVPVVAAGGIRDGKTMLAALSLGAEGVQIGTRFACSIESSASDNYKQALINATEPATVLTLKKLSPTRMLWGKFAGKAVEAEQRGAETDELHSILDKGRARKGLFEGDLEEGYMEAGEIAGDIKDIPSAGDIVQDIVGGFERNLHRVNTLVTS